MGHNQRMPDAAVFRVRWFRQVEGLTHVEGEVRQSVVDAVGEDRTRAASVEADGGDGMVLCIALGGAGLVFSTGDETHVVDPVLRFWTVDGAAEEVGSAA